MGEDNLPENAPSRNSLDLSTINTFGPVNLGKLVEVLILLKVLMKYIQPQHQLCMKTLPPCAEKFTTPPMVLAIRKWPWQSLTSTMLVYRFLFPKSSAFNKTWADNGWSQPRLRVDRAVLHAIFLSPSFVLRPPWRLWYCCQTCWVLRQTRWALRQEKGLGCRIGS